MCRKIGKNNRPNTLWNILTSTIAITFGGLFANWCAIPTSSLPPRYPPVSPDPSVGVSIEGNLVEIPRSNQT